MTIRDKFGISESSWVALCRAGAITAKFSNGDLIIDCYKSKRSSGLNHTNAVNETADEMGISAVYVYRILRELM